MVEYLIGSMVAVLFLLSIVNRYYYVETLGAFSNLEGLSEFDSKYVAVVSNYKGGLLRGTITFTLTVTNRANVSDTQELTCVGHYSRQFPFYPIRFSYFKAENTTTGNSNRTFGKDLANVACELADSIEGYWNVRRVSVRAGLVPFPSGFTELLDSSGLVPYPPEGFTELPSAEELRDHLKSLNDLTRRRTIDPNIPLELSLELDHDTRTIEEIEEDELVRIMRISMQMVNNSLNGARPEPKHFNDPAIDNNLAIELVGNNADFSFQDCAMINSKSKRGEIPSHITCDEYNTPTQQSPSCIPKGNITTSYPSEFDTLDSDSSSSSSSSDSPSSD